MVQRRATIKVDADVSKAVRGLKEVSKQVSEAEAHMHRWQAESKKAMEAFDAAGQASSKNYTAMGIGLDKLKGGVAGLIPSLKTVFGAGGLIWGIGKAAGMVSDLAKESLEAQAAMNNLRWSVAGAADAAMGLVDNGTLANSQVRALQLGAIDTLQGFEDLTEAGAKLGLVMMGDAAKGVDDLTTALSRSSPLMLDNLGITLTIGQAKEEYAAQLGKTVDALTEVEKAEAFRTIGLQRALAAAREKNIEDSWALKTRQAEVELANLKLEGLGAEEKAIVKLETAYEKAGIRTIEYGADAKKLERELLKLGTSTKELSEEIDVQRSVQILANAATEKAAEAQREAAKAEEERLRNSQHMSDMLELQGEIADIEFDMAEARITGSMTARELSDQEVLLAQRTKERAEEAFNHALMTGAEADELDRLEKSLRDASSAFVLAEKKRDSPAKRRGGGRRGKTKRDLEEEGIKQRRRELERLVEALDATGQSTTRAKLALLDFDVSVASGADKVEAMHARRIFMVKDQMDLEAKGAEARQAAREEWWEMEREDLEKAREAEEKEFELRVGRLERQIGMREALGEKAEFMHRRLAELHEERLRAEGDINGAEQTAHEERMRRLEEEMAQRARVTQQVNEELAAQVSAHGDAAFKIAKAGRVRGLVTEAEITAQREAAEAAKAAGDTKGKAYAREIAEFAESRSMMMAIQSATHFAKAAAWAAALNPVKAAAEATAGAIAAAKATALGAMGAALGNFGTVVIPDAPGAPSMGGGAGGSSGAGRPSLNPQDAPVSPLEQNGQPVPSANQAPGGSQTVINIEGSLVDGAKLLEILEDAAPNGRAFAGGAG